MKIYKIGSVGTVVRVTCYCICLIYCIACENYNSSSSQHWLRVPSKV